jgi:hypothetical protein
MGGFCRRMACRKSGAILMLVLIFLVTGALLLPPLLSYMGTALKHTAVYQGRSERLYSADAGLTDAKWKIKYDHLAGFSPYDFYHPYNYILESEVSDLVNGNPVNVSIRNIWMPTSGTANAADPLNTPPTDVALATQLISGSGGNPPKLVITSSITSPYFDNAHPGSIEIKIQYYPGSGEDLRIRQLGAWIPAGFIFRQDLGSTIDNYDIPGNSPLVIDHASGQAILWNFNDYPYSGDSTHNQAAFPADASGVPLSPSGSAPLVSKITFKYNASTVNSSPQCMVWINTNLDLSGGGNLTYAWDGSLQIYQITSTAAGSTRVETYVPKSQLRVMGSAMAGDYVAGGNSLMIDSNPYDDESGIRDTLLTSSQADIESVPADAEVAAAYLYWSAWRDGSPLFLDEASSGLTKWNYGSGWSDNGSRFQGHYSSGGEAARYLTLKNSLNLSSYSAGSVFLTWDQSVSGNPGLGNELHYSFSTDGGASWSSDFKAFQGDIGTTTKKFTCVIPGEYLKSTFKLRYYLAGFSHSGQSCLVDNIYIGVLVSDPSVTFQIDGQQTFFDSNGDPARGTQDLISSRNQVVPNYDSGTPHGYSYSSFRDVTALVRAFSQKAPGGNCPGNALYTVGRVVGNTGDNWSYAGWSIIIVFTSPATAGHQLYLYDKFLYSDHYSDLDFDGDGKFGGTISGFLTPGPIANDPDPDAGRMTCFVGEGDNCWTGDFLALNAPEGQWANVNSDPSSIPDSFKLWDGTTPDSLNNVWNGKSVGLTADGVDIDTFHIPWKSPGQPNGLAPGDTAAHIDTYTGVDIWNVVYIMLSFRSATTTGGNLNYLVH